MLGPPGAGKGTQAAKLARALGIPHISTGDMLRQAVAEGTDLGRRAQAIMDAGDLVPDELVTAMVIERLGRDDARCGYLLDGFPRNAAQADALVTAGGEDVIEAAVLLEVDDEELLMRLLRRAEEEGRADDNEETIRNRLAVYEEQTAPLIDYYEGREALLRIDGIGTVGDILTRIVEALAA